MSINFKMIKFMYNYKFNVFMWYLGKFKIKDKQMF